MTEITENSRFYLTIVGGYYFAKCAACSKGKCGPFVERNTLIANMVELGWRDESLETICPDCVEKGKVSKTKVNKPKVNSSYTVDKYENVYDEQGVFYCKWDALTKEEKARVKQNPASFY